jgi:hypothetical protein
MPILTRVVWAMLIAFTAATASTAVETSAGGPITVFDFTFPEEIAGARRISSTITRAATREWAIAQGTGKEP